MGSLAAMLKSQGYHITGSDEHVYPPMSTFLANQGITIHKGFDAANLYPAPDLVVIGNAMSRGNPEVEIVLERKIPYTSLPEALKHFFIQGKHSIVVSGTHGKTTTSSMIAWMLESAGKDPSFLIGGIPRNFNSGFKLGASNIFVIEGDEYDSAFFDKAAKFFHYMPDIVVLNNIEFDHADIYDNIDQIKLAFRRLINLIPGNGLLLAGTDDANVEEMHQAAFSAVQSFGLNENSYWRAVNISYETDSTSFDVLREDTFWHRFSIPLSGDHNIRNALATIGTGVFHGLSPDEIQKGLSGYQSVVKRLELKATVDDIAIYDDFAHHPTEVKTTIEGLRHQKPDSRIWAVYEPRTSTAKRKMMAQAYASSFDAADIIVIAPLHLPKKVNTDELLSVEQLVSDIRERGNEAHYIDSVPGIVDYVAKKTRSGDQVLIMSNGAFGGIHDLLITKLQNERNG
jgi:UDP-N-acetylmuramate: L-alanyl-gamma-D-glutamyl-meso-diaminopimelate ligase